MSFLTLRGQDLGAHGGEEQELNLLAAMRQSVA